MALCLIFFGDHPYLIQFGVFLWLQTPWQVVQHIGRLMNPSIVATGYCRIPFPNVFQKSSDSSPMASLELFLQTSVFQIQKQLYQWQRTFTKTAPRDTSSLGPFSVAPTMTKMHYLSPHAHIIVNFGCPKTDISFEGKVLLLPYKL